MKKCELLSPAGNMDMLRYAVMYGADAVYLGGTRFGARKYANNFSDEELIEAMNFAHLYGVRVYITINTLILEKEVDDFIEYVKFIYKIGVDAVLVQDFGMLNLIKQVVPDLEIHASTQMHNNGENIIKLLHECGVKRAVLDREMSLEDIKKLPNYIEKEVFCHGALCVSYSGQCLFSSMVLNRSGNRGECAGLCRLPYSTTSSTKPKYYLSLKDLCTVNFLDKIIEAGVDSLKIEGRMKSKEYVGYITHIYRKLIDSYYNGDFKKLSREEMKNIKLLFNRELTQGFIMNADNSDMVNRESPNHIGISLGSYKVYKNKVKISLKNELYQGDVIRFKEENKGMTINFLYDSKDRLINHAGAGEDVYVDNFLEVKDGGEVRKVSSVKLNDMINDLPKRKVNIKGIVKIKKGKPVCMTVDDGVNKISIEGAVVESSINRPINKEDVERLIKKTGATVYNFSELLIDLDEEAFVNLKDLGDIRRRVLEKLNNMRTFRKRSIDFKVPNLEKVKKIQDKLEINVVINTWEQLEAAKKFHFNIFSSNQELWYDSCVNVKYGENQKSIEKNKYIISDLGSLVNIKQGDIVHSDYMLNVINSHTVNHLFKKGVNVVGISVESDIDNIKDMISNTCVNLLEIYIYGKVQLMKMKYDPMEDVLIDRNKKKYSIKRIKDMNYLLSDDCIDRLDQFKNYVELGIKNFRLDFYDETGTEVMEVLKRIQKEI